jgi:AraC-like DNA-binding protein/mannose-6-phosphate isomerase-like protein (cupin superfamily)
MTTIFAKQAKHVPFHDLRYQRFDRTDLPVAALAEDYPDGQSTPRHHHPNAQLIHAVRGVMVVETDYGQWIVPPTRGLWIPGGVDHSTRMVGEVQMRTAYINAAASANLPQHCVVLKISPLLRELIIAAIDIPIPYSPDSRAGRLAHLLLDEIQQMGALPLHLPMPNDKRLLDLCSAINAAPADNTTATEWARRLHVDPKTIQRLFLRETGMTFGQWRTQARLLLALERLAAGDKVLTVAIDHGYDSPSAFATMFKKQFGIAPSQFFK